MNDRVKRVISFRMDRYRDIELKLEKMAAKGLLLESCGTYFWTFRKTAPTKRHYTVTYFSEGSIFQPDITPNQQTYIEYAAVAGWNFIAQLNQMQIFYSDLEQPVPFETDEREKFETIKTCMKKSFLPSMILVILVFSINLLMQFYSLVRDPIDFLSDKIRLSTPAMTLTVVFYCAYMLLDYFIWCKRTEQSITCGGACIERTDGAHRIVDTIFLCYIFGVFSWFLLSMISDKNWFILLLSMAQIPILVTILLSSIKYLKKKKSAAKINRLISCAILVMFSMAYAMLVVWIVLRLNIPRTNESEYRTVTWEVTPEFSQDYRLYSDELPLTCEDLYGPIEYDYYSYHKDVDSTIFLTKSNYRQDSLPAKDKPPELEYEILELKAGFVYALAKKQLLEPNPQWDEWSIKSIENNIFDTEEAYQRYYQDDPTGSYILFFEGKIISIRMDDTPTETQIAIITEALY